MTLSTPKNRFFKNKIFGSKNGFSGWKNFFGLKKFFWGSKPEKISKKWITQKWKEKCSRAPGAEISKFLILTPFWTQKSQNFDFLATPEGDPTVLGPAEAEKRGLGPQKPPERLFWDPPKKFFFGPKITKFRLFLDPPRVTPLFWTHWTRKSALEPLIPPRRG